MNKLIIIIALSFLSFNLGWSQYVLKNTEDVNWYSNIPQEAIYVFSNASTLLSGEQFQYKLHCFNALTNIYSKNSKVAYVELIGQKNTIFKHKIKLENGNGQGDFFIPATIETGHYKLIAYTQWMKNGLKEHYYESDVLIINPFEPINFDESSPMYQPKTITKTSDLIDLKIDSEVYNSRSPVILTLNSLRMSLSHGNYSVAVRKVDGLSYVFQQDDFLTNKSKFSKTGSNKSKSVGDNIFLPEFSGEMITGRVLDKPTNAIAGGKKVAMSVLSDEAQQDVKSTNEKGRFYFQIKDHFSNQKALFQVLGDDREAYKISIDDHVSIDYSDLNFNSISINPNYKSVIIERSVQNQIQSAYDFNEKHEIIQPEIPQAFFGNPKLNFKLDDYKRFATIGETLIEVIDHAWHERRDGKRRYIKVREHLNSPYFGDNLLPLVVVDGAFIQDHESILNFDANLVEEIDVYRDEYYYGNDVYQGIVSIKTKSGDYYKNLKGDYLEIKTLFRPNLKTNYFSPNYEQNAEERIPDNRFQLFWDPQLSLNSPQMKIEFYTSDIKGRFEITIEGFTISGQAVSITKYFEVK